MNKEEIAALINGREYCHEMTKDEEAQAKAAGLVVVFGASDDLMELRGAIHDEFGCYDGDTAMIDQEGILPAFDSIDDEDEMGRYFVRKPVAKEIEAVWAEGDYSWAYKTTIPHTTFEIVEGPDKYCRGIVFDFSELASPTK